jgi:type II secretory pathway component PulF
MGLTPLFARVLFHRGRKDFYEGLAAALRDNANLVRQLTKWKVRADRRGTATRWLFGEWLRRMRRGQALSEAMRGTVPALDTMLLAAAERSGDLAEGMEFLARTVDSIDRMRRGLFGALAQPLCLGLMFIGMLVGFSTFMVPTLAAVIPPDRWPPVGRALYRVANVVTDVGPYAGALMLGLVSAFLWSLPHWVGGVRAWCDRHVVFYALYRDYQGATFIVALAALLQAQVPIAQALKILSRNGSAWMRWNIHKVLARMERARDTAELAAALDSGLLSRHLADMIDDYSDRSQFDAALKKIGFGAMDKVTESVLKTAARLKALAIVLLGATLAFMLLGMLLTAASASSAIKSPPGRSQPF